MAKAGSELASVFERLSSGQRINRAGDDPAGLAIAEALKADQLIFAQASRNINDGQSLLSIADSALESLVGIVQRLEELASQASNGTYSDSQREALDTEAQSLAAEFFRISKSTEFNDQELFDASFGKLNLQAGRGENSQISDSLGGIIGDGSFESGTTYNSEDRASYDVILRDIDGDGVLDMVSAGRGSLGSTGYATVRIGSGSGSFGTALSYQTEDSDSQALDLGDLNNDGFLDLITVGRGTGADGYATVRLGSASGTFGAATSFATESSGSNSLRLADLDQDGNLDLVTAGQGDGFAGYATVRLGDGNGSFGSATSFATEATSSFGISLGDLNGDGNLDIVTVGRDAAGRGYATVRIGNGGGSFGSATSFSSEDYGTLDVELGDLNGDGELDMITSGQDAGFDGYVTVRLGDGQGSFGGATSFSSADGTSMDLSLGDINGDGYLDYVAGGFSDNGNGYATLALGDGRGSFASGTTFQTDGAVSYAVALGDTNGDGVLDVVTAGRTSAFRGSSSTRLSETTDGLAPLLDFSLASQVEAREALVIFENKRAALLAQRGQIGAFQSRLEVANATLEVASENFAAAESKIRDADIAAEAADLTRLQILQQASTAILAQANLQPALALELLA